MVPNGSYISVPLVKSHSPEGSQLIARFLGALFPFIGVILWGHRTPIL